MKGFSLRKAGLVLFPLIALVLECLPGGAVLFFGAPGPDGAIVYTRVTTPYFHPGPFAYGHFGPLTASVLTCLLLAAAVLCLTGRVGRRPLAVLSAAALLASLTPLFGRFGPEGFTLVGAAVSAALAAETVLALASRPPRQPPQDTP